MWLEHKKEESNYCVYMHVVPNGKVYVGMTKQILRKRWKNGKGYKHQPFYDAVLEFGWENISHYVIAKSLSKEDAERIEKETIEKYQSRNYINGYNYTNGGTGSDGYSHTSEIREKMRLNHYDCKGEKNSFYGKNHTEETKRKISDSRIGRFRGKNSPSYGRKDTPEQIERKRLLKSKPLDMYDSNMNFIKTFLNSKEAENETGCNHSNITRVCKGKCKSIHGYIFRYHNSEMGEVS